MIIPISVSNVIMTEEKSLQPILEVHDLKKHYGAVLALQGGSFQVHQGEIIALLGPNGAGKTTMMKILTGFMEPSSGSVKIDGLSLNENLIEVQKRIGYLPENAPIYGDMLVQDYLNFVGHLRGISPQLMRSRISEAVYNTGLEDVLIRPIGELSKGFRQRVGLAQAILHRPKLLILDEPTNGLDPTQIVEIRNLIKRLAEKSTVLLSTHILSEAEATCDRAIIIIQGDIKADSKLDQLSQTSEVLVSIRTKENVENIVSTIKKIDGVADVNIHSDDHSTKLQVFSKDDSIQGPEIASRIFELAKENNWSLWQLQPQQKTLETVFKELTQ